MKQLLGKIFNSVLFAWIDFKLLFFRLINRSKKPILIYTDSRGHEITKLTNKYNPFSGYAKQLIKDFKVTAEIVPEKHTTFYDFLDFLDNNKTEYEYIVAHVGVVCFAPRPQSQFIQTLQLKKEKITRLFGEDIYERILDEPPMEVQFLNEATNSLVPLWLLDTIGEKLEKFDNLIWITCNPVLEDWVGNYKERPKNLGIVNEKSIVLKSLLKNAKIVDLTDWSEIQVKEYTCDNVHLTESGMKAIEQGIYQFVQH